MAVAPPSLGWMRAPLAVPLRAGERQELHPTMDEGLKSALADMQVHALFPVQAAVWNLLAGGEDVHSHDVALQAPTGSGKTLAYALPLVARCRRRRVAAIRVVVVAPTRELATQVHGVVAALGARASLVAGAVDVATETASLADFPDFVVATPGRLVEQLRRGGMRDAALDAIVVDEVDRLLKQRYHGWAGSLNAIVDAAGQQVLRIAASATVTKNPARLLTLGLRAPVLIAARGGDSAERQTTADYRHQLPAGLVQARVVTSEKYAALVQLLGQLRSGALAKALAPAAPASAVVVFCGSVEGAAKLAAKLSSGEGTDGISLEIYEYSSRATRNERAKALARVARTPDSEAAPTRVLVCSDAATRGIDLPVGVVISYDTPPNARAHVHRVGRTARGGRSGAAVTLLRRKQVAHFKSKILAKVGTQCTKLKL